MASINKLSIRGVRSFSPDDSEQVLEFYFPCTIIVGANGCGKTTIIESLKFAVSGSMPPGNKSGQAFVHDPRSLGQTSVKANVKLRFTGRAGNSMVVVRSMEVQQKKTTMTFKQLDGVLRSTDRDGNRVSMGHKCSELDRQLPLLLGVSKAILEHVVFCHQEDSSWPLQEGAVLKKRFDDIFDSTRYSKALEVFAKLKKEYASQVKDLKADVAGISSHRHAAKNFREELAKYNEQMEKVDDEIVEHKQNLIRTQEEQSRLDGIMEEMDEINTMLESRKNEYATQKQIINKQSSMLQDNLTENLSLLDLNKLLRDFDVKMGEQLTQKADLQTKVADLQQKLHHTQQQESELQSRVGRLEAAKDAHNQNLKARFDKMMEIGEAYALGDVLSAVTQSHQSQTQNTRCTASANSAVEDNTQAHILEISPKDIEEFYRAVAKKEDELKDALQNQRESNQKSEHAFHDHLSDIMANIKSINLSRDELHTKQMDARKELKQIGDKFQNVPTVRKSDIEEARQQAARFAKERDEANNDPRKNQIPIEIRDIESKLDHLKRDLEDDKIALVYLRQTSETHQAIAVLRGQCIKDLEILEDNTKDSAYILQTFNLSTFPKKLPCMDEIGDDGNVIRDIFAQFLNEIKDKHDLRRLALDRANADVGKSQQAVSERRVVLGHDERLLSSKRARMGQLEAPGGSVELLSKVVQDLRVYESDLGLSTPDDVTLGHPRKILAYLSNRLAEVESQSTEGIQPDSVRKIFSRLIKQAKVDDEKFACPCCTRLFETEDEFQQFRKQLKMLASEQSPLIKVNEQNQLSRSMYVRWKDAVEEHMETIEEYHRIATEVKVLTTNIRGLEERLSDSLRQLEDAKEIAGDIETEVASLRDLLDSAKQWSDAAGRIAEKRMLISQREEELNFSSGMDTKGRNLQQVEREMNDRIEQREQYTAKMNILNKEMSALMARINTVTGQASRMEQLVQEKERKMVEEQRLTQRKHELTEVIAQCAAEEKRLQEQLASWIQKQKSKETEKSRMRALNNEEEDRISSSLNSFISSVKEMRMIDLQIEKYQSSTTDVEIERVARKITELVKEAERLKEQLSRMLPMLERLVKSVEDQERQRKNLEDNIEIVNAKNSVDKLMDEISHLELKSVSVKGHETVYEDIACLRDRRESIMKATARLEGRRGEILESIRSIKRKLSAPEYKHVDEEFRVAMIKYETTQMAVKDLDKYHSALDKALLRFHSLKIAEINKIIRDLWNLTYKGEDITSIEIVSGQESGSRATRSYNYRVVMTKGSTQLDMRGRCSAGQRVLASIVIRLALAETFCVNFGCIALDEPTVNLDYNNKKGLAIALAQIIASRAQQRNFQLVLITHDEDFVGMIKSELSLQTGFQMPEKYFQVRREEGADGKFYSKIDAIDWEELI